MAGSCLCRLLLLLVPLLVGAQPAAPNVQAQPVPAGAVAPPLQVAEWVKGSPIAAFEKGRVYLVEFWAVWCGPCIGNIPHLNALQQKYRRDGLVVIGFTSPDRTPDLPNKKEGNALEAVREFVRHRGDRMDYHVASST
jgi:thiol-disulfide isomerase/thioredoxin